MQPKSYAFCGTWRINFLSVQAEPRFSVPHYLSRHEVWSLEPTSFCYVFMHCEWSEWRFFVCKNGVTKKIQFQGYKHYTYLYISNLHQTHSKRLMQNLGLITDNTHKVKTKQLSTWVFKQRTIYFAKLAKTGAIMEY